MIICRINDNKLRERMLRETDLTMDKAIKLGHAAKESKKHVKQLRNSPEQSVNKVWKSHQNPTINNCKFCALSHIRGKCPCKPCKTM